MNDPVQRPVNPRPQDVPPPQTPPPAEPPRKRSSPLLWVLLLVVLVVLGWYALTQRGTTDTTELPPTPVIDDPAAPLAEREPAARPSSARTPSTSPAARPADREARLAAQPEIPYPSAAARSRAEGTVLLLVQVDANGNATDVSVEKRSGSRDLDRAAQQAVRNWKFEPAMQGGKPVASAVRVPVDFTLQDAN